MLFFKLLASFGGIGYMQKGSGTVAAFIWCLILYGLQPETGSVCYRIILLLALLIAGTWSANKVEKIWGVDSNRVVIDEVAGMQVSVLCVPYAWPYLLAGFILFRVFDIAKPLGIRKMEKFPGGWGVMADDILAGIYSAVIVAVFHYVRLHYPIGR